MEVALAVLADASNVSREGKLNILGIFDRIWAANFPAIHPTMQLVVRLRCSPAELGQTKTVQIVLMDEDGKRLGAIEGQMALPANAKTGQPLQIDQAVPINNAQFDSPGVYQLAILVDGDEKATLPLTLIQGHPETPNNG